VRALLLLKTRTQMYSALVENVSSLVVSPTHLASSPDSHFDGRPRLAPVVRSSFPCTLLDGRGAPVQLVQPRSHNPVARIWDRVTAYGGVTSELTSRLQTVGTTFARLNPRVGNWDEAMITVQAISAPGESGAAVVNAAGEVIDHVVSGATGVYSVIHDIDYQPKATGATLR